MRVNVDHLGLRIITLERHDDARGWLLEAYHNIDFCDAGICSPWLQENHIWSKKNVLRGLHYQDRNQSFARLARCTVGKILTVSVDLRLDKPTYGQHVKYNLQAGKTTQLFVPRGFAFGFLTLSRESELQYKMDNFYKEEYNHSIRWNDPSLNIDWGVKNPILSHRDTCGMTLQNYSGDASIWA